VHGAAWYFARHGFELAETLVESAGGCGCDHLALHI